MTGESLSAAEAAGRMKNMSKQSDRITAMRAAIASLLAAKEAFARAETPLWANGEVQYSNLLPHVASKDETTGEYITALTEMPAEHSDLDVQTFLRVLDSVQTLFEGIDVELVRDMCLVGE
jgi:hypothetical protein